MNAHFRHAPIIFLLFIIFVVFTGSFADASQSLVPPPTQENLTSSSIQGNITPAVMEVGVYIISIPSLDLIKGTYTLDFYLHFRWTDERISGSHFELMNGAPSASPSSIEKIYEVKDNPVKEEWYRVRADFATPPDIHDYPFESGNIKIIIEDALLNSSTLVYVPIAQESLLNPNLTIPGWKIDSYTLNTDVYTYPWDENYSRLTVDMKMTRRSLESILQTILPPLIFCAISALGFFISIESDELVHLRYVLGTTMFLTAVMFQFADLSSLPGVGVLKLFDKFMIAVYIFLAASLVVTTLCYLARMQWQRPELIKPINRFGALISIIASVVTFLVLWILA